MTQTLYQIADDLRALEQDGMIEIPAHFAKSGRPEIIRRISIGGSR
jgi:hypothetical protein